MKKFNTILFYVWYASVHILAICVLVGTILYIKKDNSSGLVWLNIASVISVALLASLFSYLIYGSIRDTKKVIDRKKK